MEKDGGVRRKRERAGEELRLEKDGGDRPGESLRKLEKDKGGQRTDETG